MRKGCEFFMYARVNVPEKEKLQDIPYCRKIQKTLTGFDYCKKCSKGE